MTGVQDAFRAIPRRLFIPDTIWIRRDDGWAVPLRRQDDPERWERECASDEESVITQVDDGKATDRGIWPTSSSSDPELMAKMLDALDVHPGMRVLEIGTGTGYNAALLAHLAGPENVTTIEIDATVADQARRALHRTGHPVQVITADGEKGHPPAASFDRIIATAAAHRLPYAWIEQARPGACILVPWALTFHPAAPLAVLTVGADGTAEGRFTHPSWFMPLRGQRISQAVIQQTEKRWNEMGRPDSDRFGLTITPEGRRIWLDTPGNVLGGGDVAAQ